ncbi:MAG: hypothetical protein K5872_05210 [Rhizobiaceae bacterium]|nr:hypothetical protein [Rhizobiaceae bacterium]MCV0405609.1 hypothetical protein [Rhizobiaceae bacterium]
MARLFLGVFALLSVVVDPDQPTHAQDLAYALLVAYVAYAAVLVAASMRFSPRRVTELTTHAVDVTFFSLLIYLTDGPVSPFFVYFSFVLFSATMRWGWRGAIVTTSATVLIFVAIILFSDAALMDHIDRSIIRIVFLITAGVLFSYFGGIVERARLRLARLAAWPAGSVSTTRMPAFEPILGHAASTMGAARLLVVWENELEPRLHMAEFQDGGVNLASLDGGFANAGEFPLRAVLLGPTTTLPPPLPTLLGERGIRHAILAPLSGSSLKGVVLFIGDGPLGRDLLPLANIAAMRIGAEIEQHNLRLRFIDAAATEERARLARDIHDDLLQTLTAVSLQLRALEPQLAPGQGGQLARIRQLLSDQQGRLRWLVTEMRSGRSPSGEFAVALELSTLLRKTDAQWHCTTALSVQPAGLTVGEREGKALSMLVAEAVANGVRHGEASDIAVNVDSDGKMLTLRISDNGSGDRSLRGTFDHETVMSRKLGSASLRERVRDLGWSMKLSSERQGLEIEIEAPLQ